MKAKTASRCRPLPEGSAGFWVELVGNPNATEIDDDDLEDAVAEGAAVADVAGDGDKNAT